MQTGLIKAHSAIDSGILHTYTEIEWIDENTMGRTARRGADRSIESTSRTPDSAVDVTQLRMPSFRVIIVVC